MKDKQDMTQKSKTAAKAKKAPAKSVRKTVKSAVKRESAGAKAKSPKAKKIKIQNTEFPVPKMQIPGIADMAAGTSDYMNTLFKMPDFNNMTNGMEMIMPKQNFQFDQMANDTANAGRESMEAFIKSGTILAKGLEDIMRTAASLSQGAVEKQAEMTKQIMGAKTLNEFTAAQNKIAQLNFQEFMANATKLSEMSVKIMNESIAPLNDQMNKGLNRATKMAA
ncbi:MAG: phasin family protein [Alphaproteobacteria bacterium]|nr:phasin family protein [Alphaproteobacteria bacterium]